MDGPQVEPVTKAAGGAGRLVGPALELLAEVSVVAVAALQGNLFDGRVGGGDLIQGALEAELLEMGVWTRARLTPEEAGEMVARIPCLAGDTLHGQAGVPVLVLCHGVQGGHWQITEVIKLLVNGDRKPGQKGYVDITPRDVDIICAGINHQTWYTQVRYQGEDWTGRLLEGFEKHPASRPRVWRR